MKIIPVIGNKVPYCIIETDEAQKFICILRVKMEWIYLVEWVQYKVANYKVLAINNEMAVLRESIPPQ